MASGSASPLAQLVLAELQKYPTLDPKAVLAIAAQEGLGGGVGDQGTSFGPFQLHEGGALPSWVPLSNAQKWAWSPQGLDYALSRIQSVAGGLKGAPAIEAISSRFERPANVAAEVAGAERAYGLPVTGGATISGLGGAAPVPRPTPNLSALAQLIGSTNQSLGLGGPSNLAALFQAAQSRGAGFPPAGAARPTGGRA